jgi:hypothetical protein
MLHKLHVDLLSRPAKNVTLLKPMSHNCNMYRTSGTMSAPDKLLNLHYVYCVEAVFI